jgi:MYXO-CTERM domain-containing protein
VDEAWKQLVPAKPSRFPLLALPSGLPCAAVIVCASVLGSGSVRAQEPEPTAPSEGATELSMTDQAPKAPTCGAACHGGVDYQDVQPPPPEIMDAPTCGPSCHDGRDQTPPPPDEAPPPVQVAKKGCAVEDVDDGSPLGLAALSLGLLAGIASRRRRES